MMEIVCLDVGDARIGVARANSVARLPEPMMTVSVDGNEINEIIKIVEELHAETIVVGMPRNLSGEKTQQSSKVEDFSAKLQATNNSLKIVFQDESLTTKKAEELLRDYSKRSTTVDIDQMSAVVILKDYLNTL